MSSAADPLVWHEAWADVAGAAVTAAVATLALGPEDRILDLGTGTGIALPALAATGADVTAIDLDARLVDAALARVRAAGDRVNARVIDIAALFADSSSNRFSAIWAGDVLWRNYFADPAAIVARLAGLLRPGGRVAIFTGNWYASRFLCGHPDLERRVQAANAVRWRVPADGDATHHELPARWLLQAGYTDVRVTMHPIVGCAGGENWAAWRRYLERCVWPDLTAAVSEHGSRDDRARLRACITPGSSTYLLDQPGCIIFQPAMLIVARLKS